MEHQERVLERIVALIERRGWRLPALFLLEAGQPLALLSSQLVWIGQPVLGLFWPRQGLADLAQFLETPGNVPRLIARLEEDSRP
jgi:hypothetical protein